MKGRYLRNFFPCSTQPVQRWTISPERWVMKRCAERKVSKKEFDKFLVEICRTLCLSDTIDAPRFALILRLKIIRCYYSALSNKTQHSFLKNFAIHFYENFVIHVIMHRFQQKFRPHPSPQMSILIFKWRCRGIELLKFLCYTSPSRSGSATQKYFGGTYSHSHTPFSDR